MSWKQWGIAIIIWWWLMTAVACGVNVGLWLYSWNLR